VAVSARHQSTVDRLVRFSLTTADAHSLALFYEKAFGCQRLATEHMVGAGFERLMGVQGGARRVTLTLGREIIELLQFDQPGRPYPDDAPVYDPIFQHFAIVVKDMSRAYRSLSAVAGWTAISRAGPQTLPPSSGGVTAFKFRDPEGHPLEILAFPDDNVLANWRSALDRDTFLGIDHSAISVADTTRSVAFYENLGFEVGARSSNQGQEQEKLDNVAEARVEVTTLKPGHATPHLELLCYRNTPQNRAAPRNNADVATTRLVLQRRATQHAATGLAFEREVIDPDGHHVLVISSTE
jgi:catechol 2,3-dioxygenase-like lactoylglutathione lyase family enzyme